MVRRELIRCPLCERMSITRRERCTFAGPPLLPTCKRVPTFHVVDVVATKHRQSHDFLLEGNKTGSPWVMA